jgi:hypothetical protein
MGTKGRLRRLEKAMRGKLDSFALSAGGRFYFEPMETYKELFLYWSDSLRAVADGEERPEPPGVLEAVAGARDREKALRAVYPEGVSMWIPLDVEALVSRGEFVPRPLVAGRAEDDPVPDLSE